MRARRRPVELDLFSYGEQFRPVLFPGVKHLFFGADWKGPDDRNSL
jgi:hypothetical protein